MSMTPENMGMSRRRGIDVDIQDPSVEHTASSHMQSRCEGLPAQDEEDGKQKVRTKMEESNVL